MKLGRRDLDSGIRRFEELGGKGLISNRSLLIILLHLYVHLLIRSRLTYSAVILISVV